MRHKILAGNWKMNLDLIQGKALLSEILDSNVNKDIITIIAPPSIHLNSFNQMLSHTPIALAAQNCHQQDSGAYTGELSVGMLKSVGVEYVLIGHSERREYFMEDSLSLSFKVNNVIKHGLRPIYCCGETLAQRQEGEHFRTISNQIEQGIFQLNEMELLNCIVAYEPVWAIGTGETASPQQAQEVHNFIRKTIAKQYSDMVADNISILYGGSVKPSNAKELFTCPDIDGGLIGGASLNAESFVAIGNSL
ncbi:MAG: triose-phosphate isomerase [Bacteroidia bacterium]|nr:triose-phosphate isomerase [Bacteroidia bacterium]|tara:strand:- start:1974 stop:2723 length:750 start_codon:yes stop_codon:yes gene_type:complete